MSPKDSVPEIGLSLRRKTVCSHVVDLYDSSLESSKFAVEDHQYYLAHPSCCT